MCLVRIPEIGGEIRPSLRAIRRRPTRGLESHDAAPALRREADLAQESAFELSCTQSETGGKNTDAGLARIGANGVGGGADKRVGRGAGLDEPQECA